MIISISVIGTCFFQRDKNKLLIEVLALSVCLKFITEGSYSTALVLFTIYLFKLNLFKKNDKGRNLLSDSAQKQVRLLLIFYAIGVFSLLIIKKLNESITFSDHDFSFGAICLLITVYLFVFRRIYE